MPTRLLKHRVQHRTARRGRWFLSFRMFFCFSPLTGWEKHLWKFQAFTSQTTTIFSWNNFLGGVLQFDGKSSTQHEVQHFPEKKSIISQWTTNGRDRRDIVQVNRRHQKPAPKQRRTSACSGNHCAANATPARSSWRVKFWSTAPFKLPGTRSERIDGG